MALLRVFDFSEMQAGLITEFDSSNVYSLLLGSGSGSSHFYCVYCEAGGVIGAHPTGFCQLFLVVEGAAWVEGEAHPRTVITRGQGAFFDRGEMHSKGSDNGAMIIMLQADTLRLAAPESVPR